MMVELQFYLPVFVCLVGALQAVQQLRSSKTILNSNFVNKQILEADINNTIVNYPSVCAYICTDTSACLSFAFNKLTQTCLLFDKDFTDVNSTQTAAEDGWNYSYIVRDYEEKPVNCSAPYIDELCSLFCLTYIHRIWPYSQVYGLCEPLYGGEMVRVDRELKQYCVEKILVVPFLRHPIYIQGRRNETTNKWTFDDGTEMAYFNWDTATGQPSNQVNETYLGIDTFSSMLWADLYDNQYAHGTICQQT